MSEEGNAVGCYATWNQEAQPQQWVCSYMLQWVKCGSKHKLQQLWGEMLTGKHEWRDVPLESIDTAKESQ